ncbi:hypothetical protein ACFFGV_19495 [Pontibacillus salicampi]|uniref:Uncharacterized protein n=1 Tax=Pontibacillus salicampi TaxID=1449801 RepID=A0ABV6LTL6_9BACI
MKNMQIFCTFEDHSYLEIAISNLVKNGIEKDKIFAIPLDNRPEASKIFDTLHRSDGKSVIDIAMPLATAFAVVLASIGFELEWGPIYWGLIGAVFGFLIGLAIRLIQYFIIEKKTYKLKGKQSEVILIVECDSSKGEQIEKILWEHLALGLAKILR